ncbi:MAG TPA: hypothetical protein VJ949_07390 [Cryomorphaceae bacterium]|nr:hypothetical protein [Cryomorphaceae bacterium]
MSKQNFRKVRYLDGSPDKKSGKFIPGEKHITEWSLVWNEMEKRNR